MFGCRQRNKGLLGRRRQSKGCHGKILLDWKTHSVLPFLYQVSFTIKSLETFNNRSARQGAFGDG